MPSSLEYSPESPRIASAIDLSGPDVYPGHDRAKASPKKGSVVTGPYHLSVAEGFPRHYPPAIVSSLDRDRRVGLRRYERV